MNRPKTHSISLIAGLAIAAAALCVSPNTRANVFASNIKLNGALSNTTVNSGSSLTISYILNEPATLGATLNILSGTNIIRTYNFASGSSGALRGSNVVTWDGKDSHGNNVSAGAYTLSIIASATGYTNWTQISVDTDPYMWAYYPWGIDVDKNTNSPYYGRVVMSCGLHGSGTGPVPAAAQQDGFYKMNADGSAADEGWYGNASYFQDDGGFDAPIAGQMPSSGGFNPGIIRIGEDDRVYWCDNTAVGTIVATDIQTTTNQIVITSGTYTDKFGDISTYGGPHNYGDNPEISYLVNNGGNGVRQFDVSGTTSSNAAIYLVDTGDFHSWGVWMYHMTNGASDTNDTVGTQCVVTEAGDLVVCSSGISVDDNLNIFVGQNRSGASDTFNRVLLYTNWNNGALPPEGGQFGYGVGVTGSPQYDWAVGTADPYMTAIWDTVINSRVNPTMVAACMANGAAVTGGFSGKNGGIRVLSAIDGSTLVTNLDIANWYNGVAFDNVGNVYGCSRTSNKWRIWSPPGTNQATTVAVETISVVVPFAITTTSLSGSTITIRFTSASSDTPASFTLLRSAAVNPASAYAPVSGAVITQLSPGVFQATATTSGSIGFYRIKHN